MNITTDFLIGQHKPNFADAFSIDYLLYSID